MNPPDEVPSGRTKREDKKKGNRYANPRSPIYLLEKILTKLEYCKKQSEARTFAEQAATVIGCLKNRMMTDEKILRPLPINMGVDNPVSIWPVYEAYQKELAGHQPPEMDFDDMLIHALEVLDNPTTQAFWQRKYPYVCVDEAQDTSLLQHAIVQKLHRTGDSLFMVGDDDQSIYAFRGAMPEAMLAFDRRYEDAAVHRMGVNFRSDQQIVLSGDGLIQRNKARAKKTMEHSRNSLERFESSTSPLRCRGSSSWIRHAGSARNKKGGRIRRALPSCTETTFPPYCHWLTFSKTTFPSSAIRCSMF